MAGQPKTRAKREAARLAEQQAEQDGAQLDAGAAGAPPPPPADKPPRRARGRPRKNAATAGAAELAAGADAPDRRPVSIRKIQDGLTQLFVLAGLATSVWVDEWDGQVLVLNAERNARAWADLAAQSPTVRKALEGLLVGSAWGTAIGTTAMTLLPILAHHGVVPLDTLAMAAGQGVKLPDAAGAAPPADRPPAPAAFSPDASMTQPAPAPPPPEPPARHPMDGSPTGAPIPDPTAPPFPFGENGEQAA
jgi:hypothetical protein